MPQGLRAVPILQVTDVAASADALAAAFGFAAAGYWRDASGTASFTLTRLGAVTLGLSRTETAVPPVGWAAYIHVDDVDAIADLARARGMPVSGPVEKPYHCREVEVTDRDGNILCFSHDLRPGTDGPGL